MQERWQENDLHAGEVEEVPRFACCCHSAGSDGFICAATSGCAGAKYIPMHVGVLLQPYRWQWCCSSIWGVWL